MRNLLHFLTRKWRKPVGVRRPERWEKPELIDPPLRPLSPSRPRRLTNSQSTRDQQQSPLIARLPAEIRVLIWAHVVGREDDTDVLHIEVGDGILRYNHCYERGLDSPGFQHRCWTQPFRKRMRTCLLGDHQPESYRRRAVLPLLFTCKLVYTESADLLYSANTFDFRRTDALIRLPRIMLPHRLRQIQRVQFSTAFACYDGYSRKGLPADYWRLPDARRQWATACGVLASLPRLQYARITLVLLCQIRGHLHDYSNASLLYGLLEPLKEVHASVFVVEIGELLQEMIEQLGETPFRLVEREMAERRLDLEAIHLSDVQQNGQDSRE